MGGGSLGLLSAQVTDATNSAGSGTGESRGRLATEVREVDLRRRGFIGVLRGVPCRDQSQNDQNKGYREITKPF